MKKIVVVDKITGLIFEKLCHYVGKNDILLKYNCYTDIFPWLVPLQHFNSHFINYYTSIHDIHIFIRNPYQYVIESFIYMNIQKINWFIKNVDQYIIDLNNFILNNLSMLFTQSSYVAYANHIYIYERYEKKILNNLKNDDLKNMINFVYILNSFDHLNSLSVKIINEYFDEDFVKFKYDKILHKD